MTTGVVSAPRLVLWVLAPRGIVEFDLTGAERRTIGRAATADIFIDDPSVSRDHAAVTVETGALLIADLGSKNGTFVDGVRLGAEPRRVVPGQPLRLGQVELELRLVRPRAAEGAKVVAPDEFDARLADEVERCLRYERAVGVLVVDFAADAAATAREAVVASLRALDVVATRAPGRLEVLLAECAAEETLAAAQRVSATLLVRQVAARVGAATFPGDAPSAESLLRAATLALQAVAATGVGVARQAARVLRVGAREVILAEPAMLRLYALVDRLAAAPIPVLIVGETGSGKEIVAEALHALGPRAARPLVKVNCAAVPEGLLETELFGHVRGAFTGALAAKPGLIEEADGGTFFLDEISEMSPGLQAKLLRVLEDGRVRRLGAVADHQVDVRFVAATHRDLRQAVATGAFREDLFYRLDAMTLHLPPLRERRREILPLAEHFANAAAPRPGGERVQLSPGAAGALQHYGWPGNVRELRNVVARAALLAEEGMIQPRHLGPALATVRPATPAVGARALVGQSPTLEGSMPLEEELRALERTRILEALEACGGNQTRAAQRLRMPRRTLVSKLAALGIEGPRKRRTETERDEP